MNKEYFLSNFSYDPITGLFTRLSDDVIITAKDSKGYIVINIDHKQYLAHRVAFYFMGKEPPIEVDHKNTIRHDNCWENLREADRTENCRNSSTPITNTSGYKGVHWHKNQQCWHVNIRLNGKKKHLGSFRELEKAAEAYRQAAVFYYGEFANYD